MTSAPKFASCNRLSSHLQISAPATLPAHRLMRPYPQFDSVNRNSQTPGGSSSYNALLVKLSKQFSGGLMLLTRYQWSKAIDNIGETEPSPGGAANGFAKARTPASGRTRSSAAI